MAGKFITFEGGEGSGKSTQCKRLASYLVNQGHEVVLTREPGGTEGAEEIRQLLVQGEPGRWHPVTETLLMFSARSDHYKRLIKPALDQGKIVICDRFIDSSFAYQGFGRDLGIEPLKALYEFAVGDVYPDLTFILDIDPEVGLGRAKSRAKNYKERFEQEDLNFHQKVRDGYLKTAELFKDRIHILDANFDVDVLEAKIRDFLDKRA